ncbi:hypothetical protein QTP88_017255 [Uroleucon formosanum]
MITSDMVAAEAASTVGAVSGNDYVMLGTVEVNTRPELDRLSCSPLPSRSLQRLRRSSRRGRHFHKLIRRRTDPLAPIGLHWFPAPIRWNTTGRTIGRHGTTTRHDYEVSSALTYGTAGTRQPVAAASGLDVESSSAARKSSRIARKYTAGHAAHGGGRHRKG